jgi:hypothetical protein
LGLTLLAALLYLLLMDAAVETFVSGSPLRWIISGAVAGYLALSVLLWRKLSWGTKASVSCIVWLGLMVFAAWRTAGSDSAITLLQQPTSTLLSAVTILGILLAGWIIARLKFLPWPARVALVLFAAYGVAAFVLGIMARSPYAGLLHGGSLWEKLPFWLQGAFIGAVVVLPAALLLQLVTGVPRIRAGQLREWGTQVLALGMCAAITASGITIAAGPSASVARLSPQEKQQAYKDEVDALQSRLTRLQSYLDGFPKAPTDVEALAQTLTTPQAAFEFVRDQVAFEPYPGVMKGAGATLLTRGGNSLDRALLLAAILKQNGVTAKIAHGKLSPEQAQNLLQQIATSPGSVEQMIRSVADHAPAATLTDHQQEFGKRLEERGQQAGSDLRDAIDKNLPAIQASVKKAVAPSGSAANRQLEVLADHYWVQATVEGHDTDFDPSLTSAAVNQKLTDAAETLDPESLAEPLFQHLRFRLVGEFLEKGSLQTTELLAKEFKATDLFGKNLRVAIAPLTRKTKENRFQAALLAGDDRTDSQEFRLSGQASAGGDQSSNQGSGVDTGAGKAAGGLLGGLGGEEEQETPAPKPQPTAEPNPAAGGPVLARLFLEVTSTGPHLEEAHYQRVILDRLDASRAQIEPALADGQVVRPLLIQAWDGAVSMGSTSLVYVLSTQLARMKDTQSVEQKARARAYLGESFGLADLPGPALPSELTDYFFSSDVARFVLGKRDAPRAKSYYERPRLAFFRHGFAVRGWLRPGGALRFTEGIDLFNAPFQFVGDSDDALRLAMETGIADTALERLTVKPDRSFNTVPLFAAASGQGVSILTITPQQGTALADVAVPPAIRNVLAGELARGQTLVLPAGLVKLGSVPTFGWWSVDPATGVALGKMELGGAQALVEYNEMNERMEKWEEIFTKFYGGVMRCYMMAFGENLGAVEKGPFGVPQPGSLGGHGAPGEDPAPDTGQVADCIIDKACEAIADITVMIALEPAFAKTGEQEIQILKEIIKEWLMEKATTETAKWGLGAACNEAGGAKD